MSSRGSPVPRLADPPASPFQPVLPSSTTPRPLVRRPVPSTSPLPASRPFGEIGKEGEDPPDNWDAVSVMSASTVGGRDEEAGGNAFVPLYRDVRQRRPVVRKPTMSTAAREQKAEGRAATVRKEETAPEKAAAAAEGATTTTDAVDKVEGDVPVSKEANVAKEGVTADEAEDEGK